MSPYHFTFSSKLAAPAERVWADAITPQGINGELFPLARMTVPRGMSLDLVNFPIGQKAMRSWILMFGMIPIDYDDLMLTRLDIGRGFREESVMWTQSRWVHERIIEPIEPIVQATSDKPIVRATSDGSGCVLTDNVEFTPRVPFLGAIFSLMFQLTFWNRHRRLRKRYGVFISR